MNVDVNVKVTLDLSPLFVDMLCNVLVRVPNARVDDLDERIEAAVGRAVQLAGWDRDAGTIPPVVTEPEPAPSAPAEAKVPEAQVAAQPDEGPRWTEERHAVLDFYFPAGDALGDILPRLNALPGPLVSYDQMKAKIVYRKLKRSVVPPPVPVPAPMRVTAQAVPLPRLTELFADDATIRHWAGCRGLCSGSQPLDLVRINAKRVEFGLPPFIREKGLGR